MEPKIEKGLITLQFTPSMCARLAHILNNRPIEPDHQDLDDALGAMFKACQMAGTAFNYMHLNDYQEYMQAVEEGR